jgi:serine protease Do
MFPRVRAICFLIVALATVAAGQSPQRATLSPLQIPEGLVYVSHRIDLAQQIGAADYIMTLDGEAPPRMLTTNVTLGVVIDGNGHILTRLAGITPDNPPQGVTVTLPRGRPTQGQFIGLDVVTGLCVLKVEDPAFKAPTLSPPAALRPQRNIRLFGFNPRQDQSPASRVTLFRPRIHEFPGRIAQARNDFRYSASNPIYYLLAPNLTPVQDGSLVVDGDGSIFGLAVYDISGEGHHLVYPITRAQTIAQTVINANGSIAHGWLGATGIDAPIAIQTPVAQADRGVRVVGVFPDSPAWAAGIKQSDLLLSVSGRPVDSVAKLTSTLKQLPADSEVTLKVKRGNEYKFLQARLTPAPALGTGQQLNALVRQLEEMERTLKSLPLTDPQRSELAPKVTTIKSILAGVIGPAPSDVRLRVLYGLEVQPLTAQLAKHFAVPGGLLVSVVVEGNKAARAGLRAGDVIIQLGEQPVTDLDSLLQALTDSGDTALVILISRQREQLQLTFPADLR